MAKYDIICIVDGKTAYNFGTLTTRGTAGNLCKQMARRYYDTLCAVHNFGRAAWGAIDPATGKTADGVAVNLNAFISGCMYKGFTPEPLPAAIDVDKTTAAGVTVYK